MFGSRLAIHTYTHSQWNPNFLNHFLEVAQDWDEIVQCSVWLERVLVLVWFVGSLEMLIVLEIDWLVFVTCMWGLFDSVSPCSNCFIFQIRSQRDSDPVPYLYLPDELVLLIFSFLPHKDLVSCSRVCWQFYRISMDESLCKSCLSFFMFLPLYCHRKN